MSKGEHRQSAGATRILRFLHPRKVHGASSEDPENHLTFLSPRIEKRAGVTSPAVDSIPKSPSSTRTFVNTPSTTETFVNTPSTTETFANTPATAAAFANLPNTSLSTKTTTSSTPQTTEQSTTRTPPQSTIRTTQLVTTSTGREIRTTLQGSPPNAARLTAPPTTRSLSVDRNQDTILHIQITRKTVEFIVEATGTLPRSTSFSTEDVTLIGADSPAPTGATEPSDAQPPSLTEEASPLTTQSSPLLSASPPALPPQVSSSSQLLGISSAPASGSQSHNQPTSTVSPVQPSDIPEQANSGRSSQVAPAVGGTLGAVVLLIISVVLAIVIRRRLRERHDFVPFDIEKPRSHSFSTQVRDSILVLTRSRELPSPPASTTMEFRGQHGVIDFDSRTSISSQSFTGSAISTRRLVEPARFMPFIQTLGETSGANTLSSVDKDPISQASVRAFRRYDDYWNYPSSTSWSSLPEYRTTEG